MTPAIAGVIAFSILVYVALTLISVAEATSIYDNFLFWLNFAFIGEVALRAFTYRKIGHYLKVHFLDMIAVFPWDFLVMFSTGYAANSNLLVLIRLFRLFRLSSFFSLWKDSLKSRIAYTIKKQIEQSLFRQCLILLGAIVSLTIVFGFLFKIIGYTREGTSLFYMAFMALLDPGISIEVAGKSLVIQILFNFLIMLGIILFNGLTIGIIVAKVESYLRRVKDGYGDVVEKNHTLILGWNLLGQQLLEEINDYAKHESKSKQKIVIVTEHIESLSRFLKSVNYKYLDIIKRKGTYFENSTLKLVDTVESSKIIILNENNDLNMPLQFRKSDVFKGCLAVNSSLSSMSNPPRCYYETTCKTNRKRLSSHLQNNFLGFDEANYSALLLTSILFNQYFYEILIELFAFSNDEFHFVKASDKMLENCSFDKILASSKNVIPIGIVFSNGKLEIMPSPNYKVGADDVLIFLAESRDALLYDAMTEAWHEKKTITINEFTASNQNYKLEQQRIAVIGVNGTLPALLNELSVWNTYIDILTTKKGQRIAEEYFADSPIIHPHINFITKDFKEYNLEDCFGTIILADDEHILNVSPETGDTDTLFKLFDIKSRQGDRPVIAEVLNPSEESLFQRIDGVKYIVGTKILAKILNMSLVYPDTLKLFDELISLNGASLNFAKISDITKGIENENILFTDLYYEFYRKKGCIAIGVIRKGVAPLVNPLRTEQLLQPEYTSFSAQEKGLILLPDDKIVFLER